MPHLPFSKSGELWASYDWKWQVGNLPHTHAVLWQHCSAILLAFRGAVFLALGGACAAGLSGAW